MIDGENCMTEWLSMIHGFTIRSLAVMELSLFHDIFLSYLMLCIDTIITWMTSLPIWTTTCADRLPPGIAEQSDVSQNTWPHEPSSTS